VEPIASSMGLVAPRRMLNLTVPSYNVGPYMNVLTGMAHDDQDIRQGATLASIPYGMGRLLLGVMLAGFDQD
jgi:hypothetical protein